jgi:hypothetical protein
MNLYEYSQLNNTEMGLKITSEQDPKLYEEINETVKKIVRNSPEFQYEIKKVEKSTSTQKVETPKKQTPPSKKDNVGYCIRCHNQMELNPDKPLCSKCYPIWAKYSDITYPEKYCHICGKESKQSVEKPVCYSCYKKFYK